MLKILVADDETPIRDWIVYNIEREQNPDFQLVGSAKSGKEAYDLVLEHKPNVVITDIKMPGMDGIELMQQVKKVLPYTMFIILTNHAEFSYAREAVTYGAKQYLLKSELRSADLVEALNKLNSDQNQVIQGKQVDYYSNGYLDLYDLYQHYEDPAFAARFLEKNGMAAYRPYCFLGLREYSLTQQETVLRDLVAAQEVEYVNYAIRQQVVYVILQDGDDTALKTKADAIAEGYRERCDHHIAVGRVTRGLEQAVEELKVVGILLQASFYLTGSGVIHFWERQRNEPLDRAKIRVELYETVSHLTMRRYDESRAELERWFDRVAAPHFDDIVWAREMCLKMVFSIEERFLQLHASGHDRETGASQLDSLDKCRQACLDMLGILSGGEEEYSGSIREALAYIHQHYSRDLSLVEVAQHVFRSPEYFSRQFKEETGENFSVYLMMYRLGRAEELLKTSEMKIYEIAHAVGYTTPSYFSKIYRKYMGVSPEATRSQYRSIKSK